MKAILCILLSFCLVACNTPPAPPAPPPPIPPAPVVDSTYIIREFNVDGTVKREWAVKSYRETKFPSSVTFTVNGETVTLNRSYEISKRRTP